MFPLLLLFIYGGSININVDNMYLGTSNVWVGILFAIVIIMDSFSKDEKPEIHLLLNALPYTRKEIVTSKYIGAFLYILSTLVVIIVGNLLFHQILVTWEQLLFITCLVIAFISFAFPFSYMFKSQYLFYAFWVAFVLFIMIIVLFIPNLNDIIREFVRMILTLENYQLYLLAIGFVALLYFLSWRLSLSIYQRKNFQ